MSPQRSMKGVAYDDRKRLRESIREAELLASPKKGKHLDVPDAFSFPAFAAPLAEIAQQCHDTGVNERADASCLDKCDGGELLQQNTSAVFRLWQGPGCAAGAHHTPEPQGSLSFDKACDDQCQNLTPALYMVENPATRPVQTLDARAMPLSPFECGDIPDQQSVDETVATPTSAIVPTLPDGQGTSVAGSQSSPDAAMRERTVVDQLAQAHGAEDLQNQFALVQDVSLASQNASQSSSLADTKILQLSNRLLSKDASESLHGSFKFSKAFTFHGLLGDTKTSTVYYAQAKDRLFAIKADRADMMRELRAVYALPLHANVVDYVRFWQEGRKLHIQMELCEGGSLDTLLKRSEICQDEKVPEDMLWLILSDAVNGLQHIHAHSVLHMDIKPENMYLDSSGVFKLGDFGIAINIANQSGWEEGDGRYAAPELLQRSRPTGAADIYSLGATMLHCSIGTSLPLERSPLTVRRHLAGHSYSVEFQHIVASMIADSPDDRPTAEMLCSVLQRKQVTHAFGAIRQKLAQVAAAVHAQRMAHQRTLHCSPSFSLSQSVENATPGSVGQPPAARPERVWSKLFSVRSRTGAQSKNGVGRSPSLPVDRAPVPPAPPRAAVIVGRGPPASEGRGAHLQPRVGTPPSVLPKLYQHQNRSHRSPSAGSFDRCGALSYSSNGQASGSLNLELYPEVGAVSGQGDATGVRSKPRMRTDEPIPQQQRVCTRRPAPVQGHARAGRNNAHGSAGARHSRTPLSLIVPEGRDHVQPSPRSDVLHRYFSSQAQHEDASLRSQAPLLKMGAAALSQVEVTGPCEASIPSTSSTFYKHHHRRSAAPRPPDLHELKDCLASCRPVDRATATLRAASKTKGHVMVWKGLKDVTSSSASALHEVVLACEQPVGTPDQLRRLAPVKFGQGPARRSRGAKIAGVASGMGTRDQENDVLAANLWDNQGKVAGSAKQRDFPQFTTRPVQPHQSKLRAVKTLHVSKARETSTKVLASSRPELKQPLAVCHAHNLGV